MSGGTYQYAHWKVDEFAMSLHERGGCDASPPELRRRFVEHLRDVAAAMRACEWNDSGDGARDKEALILKVLGETREETPVKPGEEI